MMCETVDIYNCFRRGTIDQRLWLTFAYRNSSIEEKRKQVGMQSVLICCAISPSHLSCICMHSTSIEMKIKNGSLKAAKENMLSVLLIKC